MHSRIGEDTNYDEIVHDGKTYRVPKGNEQFFYEAIRAGRSVTVALDHAHNPFRPQ